MAEQERCRECVRRILTDRLWRNPEGLSMAALRRGLSVSSLAVVDDVLTTERDAGRFVCTSGIWWLKGIPTGPLTVGKPGGPH